MVSFRGRVGLVLAFLCLFPLTARAFTLIGGPPTMNVVVGSAGRLTEAGANIVDPMGKPVPIKQFFRWNYPQLTYAFDSTFVRYFGHNGMAAVSNAFRVLNDYFVPEDGSYTNGVSSMDLILEYDKHFRTWEFNPSANLENVTDMESMVLGMVVNHLGLGNPHRYCFILQDVLNFNAAAGTGTFHIAMRNYDPYTYRPTQEINGVNYSYWLYNDSPTAPANITVWDAVEYAVGSDDEYSAIAGIRDVINFGGMAWPGIAPTVFRTPGVYFAPDNAANDPAPPNVSSKNRTQPRHSLTFDDAGGLRYLYRTNNIVVENLDASVTLVTPANMNPIRQSQSQGAVPPNSPFLTPRLRTLAGMALSGVVPTPPTGGSIRPQATAIVRQALRGGINTIQFRYTSFDSLIGTFYTPQSAVWDDVFVTNALPTDTVPANPPYFVQTVQRTTTVPDIIFIANDLGVAGNVIPVISLPDTTGWTSLIPPNSQSGAVANLVGPGSIMLPAANTSIQYIFTTRAPFHQVIWAGEPGIEGNMIEQFQWGWITNTGPSDYVRFPESDITQVEAITGPSGIAPTISHISVVDGTTQDFKSSPFTIDRSLDTIFIYGRRTDSTTEIQILDTLGTTVKQSIRATDYIMSDQLIKLPPGALGSASEGASLKIRLVSAVGEGAASDLGTVNAGVPIISSTQYDGLPLNTRNSLIIQGSGFRTSAGGVVNRIEFYDDMNATNYESDTPTAIAFLDDNGSWTVTDTSITIPANYISGLTANRVEFGAAGVANTLIRSDNNNTDPTIAAFPRQIRVVRTDTSRSTPRANAHKFSHIGVGGNRMEPGQTWPVIKEVFTNATIPAAPVTTADANATWVRSDDADVLVIRGHGLDLAFSLEFVDGDGNLIQSTDINGLPPQPLSLRSGVEPSALAAGVTIGSWDDPNYAGDLDGYEIRIAPQSFGMNANALFDSISGTNASARRRVVIRTPYGTVIAPPTQYTFIQN